MTVSFVGRRAGAVLIAAAVSAASLGGPSRAVAATFQVGQSVEVREGDTWSSATVLNREGRRYQVRYAGSDASSDEWVGPDRIRETGAPAPAATPSTPAKVAATPSAEPPASVAVIEGDRSGLEVIQSSEPPPSWSVQPDPAAKAAQAPQSYGLRVVQLTKDHAGVKHLFACAGGGAVIGVADFFDKQGAIDRVGTSAGSAHAVLPPEMAPMAVSPSGTLVVCRDSGFGKHDSSQLHVMTLSSSSVRPMVNFVPYPSGANDGKGTNVDYAAALSDTLVVTCDSEGELIAWSVGPGSAKGVWRADVGHLVFAAWGAPAVVSPGGKWLAIATKAGVRFIESATGHVLGAIPVNEGSPELTDLACSPTGKSLVARVGMDSLVSFDVTTGQPLRTVALPPKTFGAVGCPDDGFALVDARALVDVNTGAVVPHFVGPLQGASLSATGPGVTLLASSTRLMAVHLVDAATRKAVAAAADSALVLKPGMSLSLDIQIEATDAEKASVDAALRKRLKADGFVVADHADTVIECRTEPGEQHEYRYGKAPGFMHFLPPGSGEQMILTEKVTRMTIRQGGQVIWERKRVVGPAGSFPLQEGKSLKELAEATIRYDPKFLETVEIPPYIAKPPDAAATPARPARGRHP